MICARCLHQVMPPLVALLGADGKYLVFHAACYRAGVIDGAVQEEERAA